MEEHKSKVYALQSPDGYVTQIDGGYTISNITNPEDWVLIDGGTGDRYNLCQNNYLDGPLMTDSGVYRYKLVDGAPVECSPEEIAAQIAAMPQPEVRPTLEARVDTLESTSEDIILMMADLIGGE